MEIQKGGIWWGDVRMISNYSEYWYCEGLSYPEIVERINRGKEANK